MGYVARVLDVRPAYPRAGLAVEAIAVSAPTPCDLFETSLRMHYRVPVEEDMGVGILLEGFETPQLLDFSAGGAMVLVDASEQPTPIWPWAKAIPSACCSWARATPRAMRWCAALLRRTIAPATCGLFPFHQHGESR
jgi:hypothetical protein